MILFQKPYPGSEWYREKEHHSHDSSSQCHSPLGKQSRMEINNVCQQGLHNIELEKKQGYYIYRKWSAFDKFLFEFPSYY